MTKEKHIPQRPLAAFFTSRHPATERWNRLYEALHLLYEAYNRGGVAPRNRGYDDEVDKLMDAYDKWLSGLDEVQAE